MDYDTSMTLSPTHSPEVQQFIHLLDNHRHPTSAAAIQQRLKDLRKLVLLESIPQDPYSQTVLRPRIWSLFLHLHARTPASPLLNASTYLDLTGQAPSTMYAKIRNDTFRTLATDEGFKERVGEERLVRLLEAFVRRTLEKKRNNEDSHALPTIDSRTPYVQGMNVLAAPFLYVMPSELEAFACFTSFIEREAPRYVLPTLEGVHAGLLLVDLCLFSLDVPLHAHLTSHHLSAELYAFPSLLTFCASTPPLSEVIELWDFLLAWGVGLNVLCVCAQLWLMREELLDCESPMKLLRTFPPLKAKEIIPLAVQFSGDISQELYDAVVRHPWDDTLIIQS